METLKVFRFAEVAKYVTNAWHVGLTYTFFIVINKRKYAKLPEDLRKTLDTLAGEYQERWPLMYNAIDFVGKKDGDEQSVKFEELSEAKFDRWEKAASYVLDS
jgi:TRAP-type C4-dicarboxylate transport system substrate-binding protein